MRIKRTFSARYVCGFARKCCPTPLLHRMETLLKQVEEVPLPEDPTRGAAPRRSSRMSQSSGSNKRRMVLLT